MWEQNEIKMSNKLFPHFILQLVHYFRNSFPATEHGRHPVHVCVCVCVSYVCSCSAHALCLTKFSKLLSIFVPPTPPTAISIDVGQTAHKIFDTISFRTQDLTLRPPLFGWCRTALADRFCLWWAPICKVCQNCPSVEICDMNNYAKHMW